MTLNSFIGIININNKEITNELITNCNYKEVYLIDFSTDPVENHFSIHRYMVTAPTVLDYRNNNLVIMNNKINLKNSLKKSEKEGFIYEKNSFERSKKNKIEVYNKKIAIEIINEINEKISNINYSITELEEKEFYFFSGFLIMKLKKKYHINEEYLFYINEMYLQKEIIFDFESRYEKIMNKNIILNDEEKKRKYQLTKPTKESYDFFFLVLKKMNLAFLTNKYFLHNKNQLRDNIMHFFKNDNETIEIFYNIFNNNNNNKKSILNDILNFLLLKFLKILINK
jgi:hypothetical protein